MLFSKFFALEQRLSTRSVGKQTSSNNECSFQVETLEPRMMLSAVTIFGAGSTGVETLELLVDGQVAAEFQNVAGDPGSETYVGLSYTSSENLTTDQISIRFSNDVYDSSTGYDRNLTVDRIIVDGITYQTENSATYVSAFYGDNGPIAGNLGVQQLNMNGQFNYSSQGASSDTHSIVAIDALGTTGNELLELRIDGQAVATYAVGTSSQKFYFASNDHLTLDQIRVQFNNDKYDPANGIDRNIVVESVSLTDVFSGQSESVSPSQAKVYSNATYVDNQLATGYGRGNTLHSNGYFQFSAAENRSIDGTGNNLSESLANAGSTESELRRYNYSDPAYGADGQSGAMMSDNERTNPRDISNAIVASDGPSPNDQYLNDLTWIWGQFIDHDIDLSVTEEGAEHNGSTVIRSTDPSDILYSTGIGFTRSDYIIDQEGYRQQVNTITSYIDASNVYGSDQERADALRTFADGKLIIGTNGLLPTGIDVPNDSGGTHNPNIFVAGDIRANENVALSSMHSLFVREHNRLADKIAAQNPGYDDEQIYQLARKLVGAELQLITYNEFLPALLGSSAPETTEYGYNPSYDASIFNSFAHSAYRFGHSMLSSNLQLAAADGSNVGQVALRDAFFNPAFLQSDPSRMEQLLQGAMGQRAQEIDVELVDDVRNFLFGAPGAGGLDLAAMNIQRGRDHGLPDYNSMREIFGLRRVRSFSEITSDVQLQNKLASIYDGDVNNIDPWIGGLAEDHVAGSAAGELVTRIIAEQFQHLRDGDRLFFRSEDLGLYSNGQLSEEIRSVVDLDTLMLADILRFNTNLDPHQNIFYATSGGQTLIVNAAGDQGVERFRVIVDGQLLGTFQADSNLRAYEIALPTAFGNPAEILVEYFNDFVNYDTGYDRNLFVSSIEIGSVTIWADSSDVYSTGTWLPSDGVTGGLGRGNYLHASGHFCFSV